MELGRNGKNFYVKSGNKLVKLEKFEANFCACGVRKFLGSFREGYALSISWGEKSVSPSLSFEKNN